jgi:hypothetical protein
MSLNAATIEILIAKGLTAADILDVAKATEVKADRTNAERQARYRARRSNAVTVTSAPPNDIDNSNPPPSEPNGSKGSKRARAKSVSVDAPDWLPAGPWAAFVEMREGMHPKIPWSANAAKLVISKIETLMGEGHCPVRLLEKAVVSGWRTVFGGDDTKGRAPVAALKTPEDLEDRARWFASIGNDDEAARYRKEAERIRGHPPPAIASIIRGVTGSLRAGRG